jgi:hypothetical protein
MAYTQDKNAERNSLITEEIDEEYCKTDYESRR